MRWKIMSIVIINVCPLGLWLFIYHVNYIFKMHISTLIYTYFSFILQVNCNDQELSTYLACTPWSFEKNFDNKSIDIKVLYMFLVEHSW
jgi:hypothetical protein